MTAQYRCVKSLQRGCLDNVAQNLLKDEWSYHFVRHIRVNNELLSRFDQLRKETFILTTFIRQAICTFFLF